MQEKKSKAVVLAIVSDVHCGSTLAMVPPEGVRLDDGGTYRPSKVQSALWKNWEDFWSRVGEQRRKAKATLYILWNGDLFEGDHHRTTQIISSNQETSDYLIDRVYSVPKALRPKHQFVVRGTEAHVGASGATEEAFAHRIRATQDEEADTWSWWHFKGEINGVLITAQHHGKFGRLPWTGQNALNQQAAHIFHEYAKRKERWPDLVLRSHMHRWGDSYKAQPVRLIQTPAWQMKTAFAHKVAPNSPPDIGGIVVQIEVDGSFQVEEHLYVPRETRPWRDI
jgi:hypothetical protein